MPTMFRTTILGPLAVWPFPAVIPPSLFSVVTYPHVLCVASVTPLLSPQTFEEGARPMVQHPLVGRLVDEFVTSKHSAMAYLEALAAQVC
jgi:hypothetical protein